MKDGGRRTKSYTKSVTIRASHSFQDECSFNFLTTLTNIQPAFGNAKAGDFLDVQPLNGTLIAFNDLNEICGEIDSAFNKKIIDCISLGNEYRARVNDNRGVQVQRVR